MPPKRTAAVSVDPPAAPEPSDVPEEEQAEAQSDAPALRKVATHPTTAVMVKEALQELDSRKGASSQAIQSFIKQKYPTVDLVRLKYLVRKSLKRGIENGTLVRPANAKVTTGAMGKFRLAPKVKEPKAKAENTDPNVQKAPKAAKEGAKEGAKDGAKKPPKAGAAKKKDGATEKAKSKEDSKPPKKSKKEEEAAPTKAAPAKKPKAKKAAEKETVKEAADSTKTKVAKTTKAAKETKAEKASQSKAAKASEDAPPAKAPGKRAKKAAE